MLTDTALRNLKPKSLTYKASDRDGMYDLRRTGSTLLNEVGFNGDWIEKCLAHEDGPAHL